MQHVIHGMDYRQAVLDATSPRVLEPVRGLAD